MPAVILNARDREEPESIEANDPLALMIEELAEIYSEISEQPEWRATADKEMDYVDGNQIDSDLLRRQRELGIPPAIEDLIGPAIRALQGYEVSIRADWRVTADGDIGGQDVADALNYRLNQAERQSKADRACSDAFKAQASCGIGWVEVSRDSNPFKFPYRCKSIHRNELHWDMKSREPDLSDAYWLRRSRWLRPERIKMWFPDQAEMIDSLGRYASSGWWGDSMSNDGGLSTGLENSWAAGRARTIDETLWYNSSSKEVCLSEIWYRRWVPIQVLKTKDGRAVEFDESNQAHVVAVRSGAASLCCATVDRVRRAYWIGPHRLNDEPSPYPHNHFPYVMFMGFAEDLTGVPYGYVRGMKYPQDSLNSGVSKLRWGMAVARVERTKGAVEMTDAQLRRQVARADADIILNAEHMARPGARFEVKRDYQLTEQHYQMLADNRASIERVSSLTNALQGKTGTATSGQQESMQIEQSNQSINDLMDNFRFGRSQVGELLLSLIMEDIGEQETEVIIEGDAITDDRSVTLNRLERDESGYTYLSNDLQRTRLKVAIEDVPGTQSYRAQQLAAMSEAVKALPSNYQAAAMPFMASLMDVPFKRDLVKALREAGAASDPKEIEKRIREDVSNELKSRDLELKSAKTDAEIKEIEARAVQIGVQAAYSAMQAGAQVAQMPMIAPVADAIMQSAGYQHPVPAGVDPNYPAPGMPNPTDEEAAMNATAQELLAEAEAKRAETTAPPVRQNTSPAFPPIPDDGSSPMSGIETPAINDNFSGDV
jgi:hypothetical protein